MIPLRIVFAMLVATTISAQADEGMWLFNNPPLRQLKENYQFEPTPQWLEHLQKASVRFNSGGSGSFVSADGLCITNHHVGADALQKASSEQHNYLKEGFYAKANAEEIKCADLELNVLISIEDVTARVNAPVKIGMSPDAAGKARENAIAQIEKESKDKTSLRSDVVTLYQGGAYHLYRYKRYDDVRIVFAPEQQMAFYGGDPDNFEYPRFDLDICIFRVYENGQPAKIDNSLKWNSQGPSDGELTFVSGSRGRTDRQLPVDELAEPNGERIADFRDSAKESLELTLFSTEPVYDDYEILRLTDSLTDFAEKFGANDPMVKQALNGKSPRARAVELVSGTKLKDVDLRKKLYRGDAAGLQAAHDPMLDVARLIDKPAREARKTHETQEEIKKQAYAEIAKARFAVEGTENYPDATFTLRLSYGTVRGYEEDGKQIAPFTTFTGLYQRSAEHESKPPFDLPQRWIDKKTSLNQETRFNFVSDADIIGGNSGSPVVNKTGEF